MSAEGLHRCPPKNLVLAYLDWPWPFIGEVDLPHPLVGALDVFSEPWGVEQGLRAAVFGDLFF